jgi:two-component system response regulator
MKQNLILLVEDDPDNAALALLAWKKVPDPPEVVVARDGEEMLEYLYGTGAFAGREMSSMPRLILMDLKLPKLGGLDVLKRLRSESSTKTIPVVIFTSSSEPGDIAQSFRFGANSFVRKPIDFEDFCNTLKLITNYWLTINTMPG